MDLSFNLPIWLPSATHPRSFNASTSKVCGWGERDCNGREGERYEGMCREEEFTERGWERLGEWGWERERESCSASRPCSFPIAPTAFVFAPMVFTSTGASVYRPDGEICCTVPYFMILIRTWDLMAPSIGKGMCGGGIHKEKREIKVGIVVSVCFVGVYIGGVGSCYFVGCVSARPNRF